MRLYGRKWLVESRGLFEQLEDRIERERKSGLLLTGASELSYLSLSELTHFIFKSQWKDIFNTVFGNQIYFHNDIKSETIPLRNKLAHFRPISKLDLFNLNSANRLLLALADYYSSDQLTLFHIPSDPEYSSDWVDPLIQEEASSQLSKLDFMPVWEATSQLDTLRSRGYSIGAGIFCGHFFVEIYSTDGFPVKSLNDFLNRQNQSVTFMSLYADKLRVFFSLRNDPRECARLIRSLGKILTCGVTCNELDGSEHLSEYFIGLSIKPIICFAI